VLRGARNLAACSNGSATARSLRPSGSSSFDAGTSRPLSSLVEGVESTQHRQPICSALASRMGHTFLAVLLNFLRGLLSLFLGLFFSICEVRW
jgi:hypothetical protein